MMDFGYPQYTDPMILKDLITQNSVRSEATVRALRACSQSRSTRSET